MTESTERDIASAPAGRADRSAAPPWSGRVGLVLGSSTGGIGQHVAALARGLVESRVEVSVCGPAATEQQFGFGGRGARFVPVEIPANPALADARAVGGLRRALLADGVNVVHAHGLRAGFVAALARTGRPLVVTWHNAVIAGGLRGRASRLVERAVARAATVTLGASDDLVAQAEALGARDTRLGVVSAPELPAPRRSVAAVRAELGLSVDQPMILSVGRLHPQKGYDVLIAAAARWRAPGPEPLVVIAGTGPSYLNLAARISAVRAPVVLLGHRDDVADLLAAADLAVVTSVWEARQLFVQEALRTGTPLVATAVGGIPGLVGDAAVLVPAGDPDAVAEAVERLLTDPALRVEYGRRGLAQAAAWPTARDTVDQVLGVYAELAPDPAGGGRPDGDGRP